MDPATKSIVLAELSVVKAMLSPVSGQLGGLSSPVYPVAGNMVNLPGLPMAANAIKIQNDSIDKLVRVIEKLVDKL